MCLRYNSVTKLRGICYISTHKYLLPCAIQILVSQFIGSAALFRALLSTCTSTF
ncbi:hypothetical protein K461DRAFT_57941 [Myriangium duriaei CBS 260.36]|uniref:Uncharacterized protein n=1 Tax=Myriangium duriaei CBS 260.36 TaxID=1168546 RepID=A0A9P4IUT2_9PEZI|nr:hypothetical protein K461DRAFT_57941 [Myriangium duriaei CBS 260.36]